MQRQQSNSRKFSRSSDSSGHGIRDVVKFQIEEHTKAKASDLLDRLRTLSCKKLASDFEQARRPPEPARQNDGRPQAIHIQGDDQL